MAVDTSNPMGVVIFATPVGTSVSQAQIDAALKKAEMPDNLGRHLNARAWFIRATKNLAKTLPDVVLRDRCAEDEDVIRFAFLSRALKASGLPEYDAVCEVYWRKEAEELACGLAPAGMTPEAVIAEAKDLMLRAQDVWEAADIHQLVRRYLRSFCKLVQLRDGVCFIAQAHADKAKKLEVFYRDLGTIFHVYEVGYTPERAVDLHKTIVADIRNKIMALTLEIQTLNSENKLSKRISANRLGELENQLKEYTELARSTRIDVDEMLSSAGMAGDVLACAALDTEALIDRIQAGKAVPTVVQDLHLHLDLPPALFNTLKAFRDAPAPDLAAKPLEAVAVPAGALVASGSPAPEVANHAE